MGYFNIFYKITRIIDMLTRKRNRKFIVALCLIGAFVFFSPNMTYAQYSSLDSQNLQNIRTKINEIDSTLDTYMGDIYSSVSLTSTYAGWNYQTLTSMNGYIGTINTYITQIKPWVESIKDSALHIDSDLHDVLSEITSLSSKIDTIQDTLDNIESILNSIGEDIEYYGELNHSDQEEIKTILREYLYGTTDSPVTFKSVSGIGAVDTGDNNGKFVSSPATTIYFRIHKDYSYEFIFALKQTSPSLYMLRFGYTDNIPTLNAEWGTCTRWDGTSTDYTFKDTYDYKYFYISYYPSHFTNFEILSNYNEGQDNGIYGGLTIIDQTTINQGEQTRDTIANESQQTRDTITSTDYNQSDVSINTSSIDNVDTSNTDGLFTTIFTNFNNAARGGVDSITIPMPHNSGNLVLYSNVVSSHLGALASLVSAFWYFVFGFYAFKFVNNLLHSIKNGNILDGFKSSSEVITQDML